MNGEIEQSNQKEEEELTCPKCGKGFQDMRGLTSHARHNHNLGKKELEDLLNDKEVKIWNIVGGIGTVLLAILTLGKFR